MLKNLERVAVLATLIAAATTAAFAAPVVVTPGSNAGYLYFPSSSGASGSGSAGGSSGAGVTINGMQLAATQCYTASGTVTLPAGFTTGYIQAIIVSGGEGNTAGGISSITHADIGTVQATGVGSGGGAGLSGPAGGGGGGGGYMGTGGAGGYGQNGANSGAGGGVSGGSGGGGNYPNSPGSGFGYGGSAGSGGTATGGGQAGQPGTVGSTMDAPAPIACANSPTAGNAGPLSATNGGGGLGGSGFGAGGGGRGISSAGQSYSGGSSGAIRTVTFKYNGGPITVNIGAGGTGDNWSTNRSSGAPGVVALRFIPM